MGDILEFRPRENVRAERIEEDGPIFTNRGRAWANAGDYLVYDIDGTHYADRESFEGYYELVPESVSEAKKYSPEGKTVAEVLEFLKDNPGEFERIREIESRNGNRKGIVEYEIG